MIFALGSGLFCAAFACIEHSNDMKGIYRDSLLRFGGSDTAHLYTVKPPTFEAGVINTYT